MEDKPITMSRNHLAKLELASTCLMQAWHDTHTSELSDILDAISEYRDQYVKDNSQYGVGA